MINLRSENGVRLNLHTASADMALVKQSVAIFFFALPFTQFKTIYDQYSTDSISMGKYAVVQYRIVPIGTSVQISPQARYSIIHHLT